MNLKIALRTLAAGVFLFAVLMLSLDDDSIFSSHDSHIAWLAYGTTFLVFIFVLVLDVHEFRKKRNWYAFFPVFVCLILIGANVYLQVGERDKRHSPALVYIACECISQDECIDGKCYFIKFKRNGTYTLSEIDKQKHHSYAGKFSWKDSVITLDRSKIGKTIFSSDLVFRRTEDKSINVEKRYLSQVDKNGKELDEGMRLYVDYFVTD